MDDVGSVSLVLCCIQTSLRSLAWLMRMGVASAYMQHLYPSHWLALHPYLFMPLPTDGLCRRCLAGLVLLAD